MTDHAQLTAREIHGPFTQLFVNLQANDGSIWLAAFKRFLRKENPWMDTTVKMHGVECIPALTVRLKKLGYEIQNFVVPLGEKVQVEDVYLAIKESKTGAEGRVNLGQIIHYESEPGRSSIWVQISYPDRSKLECWLAFRHNKPEGEWRMGGGYF